MFESLKINLESNSFRGFFA